MYYVVTKKTRQLIARAETIERANEIARNWNEYGNLKEKAIVLNATRTDSLPIS